MKCKACDRPMSLNENGLCCWCRPQPEEPIKNLVADRLEPGANSDEALKREIDAFYKARENKQ